MTTRGRLRVAVLCAALPADPTHLEAAAEDVDLTVLHSAWLPPELTTSPRSAGGVDTLAFAPVVRAPSTLRFVLRGMHRALDELSPQVVHVFSEPWGLLAAQAAVWTSRHPPARLALHGCDTIWHHGGRLEQRARRAIMRYTLPRTDAWAAESEKALSLAARNGLPATSRLVRIHTNPRDGRMFHPPSPGTRADARRRLGVPDDVVAVGLLGRLVPEKGVRAFLEAARHLPAGPPNVRFFVAGDGPLRDEVLAVAEDVTYLGRLSYPDGVLDLMHALDVLACPSLTTSSWEDQGPRALIESMMCGCVPVGAPTGAIPETLGGQGMLARSTHPRHIADAVLAAARLAADPSARRRVSSWATETYSTRAAAAQLLQLWRELDAAPARRRARQARG